jgi:hypothetical protein
MSASDRALLSVLADAIRKAGATESVVIALFQAGEAFAPKRGRPRKHADDATKHRAYRARKKRMDKTAGPDERIVRDEKRELCDEAHANAVIRALIEEGLAGMESTEDTFKRDEKRDLYAESMAHLRGRLEEAAPGKLEQGADLAPIVGLIRDHACDLEADVVPIVARLLPDLPRPLKNWGAPWLVREILAARDQRLAGQPVEAPPPARRAPAIEWDE